MRKFFKNRCVLGFVIIVVIFSIIVGFVNAKHPENGLGENIVNVIVTPVQKFFTWIGNGVSDFFGNFSDKDDLKKEIARLKKENADLKNELSKKEISAAENEEFRELLKLKDAYPEFEFSYAEIIARDSSNWHQTFTIDKGSADGLIVNQTVISADKHLVGRICEVGTTWAKVITLNDPEHAVGAVVSRSGEYGVVEGDSTQSTDGGCKLSYISKNSDIVVGDTVLTSGLGGIYPEGITIGTVQEVRPDTQGTSQYAVVSPAANIEKIRSVCIITHITE